MPWHCDNREWPECDHAFVAGRTIPRPLVFRRTEDLETGFSVPYAVMALDDCTDSYCPTGCLPILWRRENVTRREGRR